MRLWIVGDDVSQDHQYRTGLEDLVAELRTQRHVTLFPRRDDMPRVMAGADVFAMPSFEEPFGLVFAEAMAMRIPVVALDNGGTKEVVIHGETGLLSPPGDHERLVAHILALLDDPGLRARMGAAGRSRCRAAIPHGAPGQQRGADLPGGIVGPIQRWNASHSRQRFEGELMSVHQVEADRMRSFREGLDHDGFVVFRDVVSRQPLVELAARL